MIVESVRNTTTEESAVQYEVTIRVWGEDLTTEESDLEFANLARNAINGIACYPIQREIICNCKYDNLVGKPERHEKTCPRRAIISN